MNFFEKKLRKLARQLFNADCERVNLLYKLDNINEQVLSYKDQILFLTNYPYKEEIYEYPPFVVKVNQGDVEVWTLDQWDKIEPLYPPEEEIFDEKPGQ